MNSKLKIDNVFIIESPLQALVALEISLNFPDEKNAIIYRITCRENNDKQIQNIINLGNWESKVCFLYTGRLAYLLHSRRFFKILLNEYHGIKRTFFGEYRAQWMHFARFCIGAEKDYLIDDGAATIYVKKKFIDKHEFYPVSSLFKVSLIRRIHRALPLIGLIKTRNLNYPFNFASAFVSDENGINVNFENLKKKFKCPDNPKLNVQKKVFFFGSKLSEGDFISIDYELEFLIKVLNYYHENNFNVVYCSHRDELSDKLLKVKKIGFIEVLRLDIPAELFFLQNHSDVVEFASAYSSVLINFAHILPDLKIRSFQLDYGEISSDFIPSTKVVYDHFRKLGIEVIDMTD